MAALTANQVLESSIAGVYIEPRKADLSGTDPKFAVVWLPKSDRIAAIRALKSFDGAQALVRVKDRYGIRVQAAHAAAASKELRPDIPFVESPKCSGFTPYPMEYRETHSLNSSRIGDGLPNLCNLLRDQLRAQHGRLALTSHHQSRSCLDLEEMCSSVKFEIALLPRQRLHRSSHCAILASLRLRNSLLQIPGSRLPMIHGRDGLLLRPHMSPRALPAPNICKRWRLGFRPH